jgi:hypothetical protein
VLKLWHPPGQERERERCVFTTRKDFFHMQIFVFARLVTGGGILGSNVPRTLPASAPSPVFHIRSTPAFYLFSHWRGTPAWHHTRPHMHIHYRTSYSHSLRNARHPIPSLALLPTHLLSAYIQVNSLNKHWHPTPALLLLPHVLFPYSCRA